MEHCTKKPGDEKEIPAFGPDSIEMAMRRRIRDTIEQASLAVLVMIALITIPTYVTGNAAALGIQDTPGVSKGLIQRHEGAAVPSLAAIEITGFVAWLALWKFRRTTRVSAAMMVVVLACAGTGLGLVARAANIGGEIRHPEIRIGQAVEAPLGK